MQYTAKPFNADKLCKLVLKSDHNIQAVEIVDREGFAPEKLYMVEAKAEITGTKRNAFRCLFEISLGEEYDDLYGPIQYNFSEEDLATIIFPLGKHLVVVRTTKNTSPISMATKIAKIIFRSDR